MHGELLLEIGPGQAALSEPLSNTEAELHLLEIDRDLAARLSDPGSVAMTRPMVLHNGDALQTDFSELSEIGRRFRLVGNLPYNISTPLLFHVLQWNELIIDMHFMLQQEVVKRMAANPAARRGAGFQSCASTTAPCPRYFNVAPGSFFPGAKGPVAIRETGAACAATG